MAYKTDVQLQAYADTNINANGANAITGTLHNTMLTDLIDSKVNSDVVIEGVNHRVVGATTAGTMTIGQYYNGKQIIIEYVSGTPVVKFGTTSGGNEVMHDRTITVNMIDNNLFIGSLTSSWILYYDVSGGEVNIYVQTLKFT